MNELLEVRDLKKYFATPHGLLHAVDGLSFSIERSKTLGIVGESGCGKSTLGRLLVRLEKCTEGKIIFDGQDVSNIKGRKLREYREHAQFIFQDPYSSLNPRMTVEELISNPLHISGKYNKKQIVERAHSLMETVGIDARLARSYPHELDGGRRQRVVIARAIALEPDFIVCDEPVSALDVSIQAQILNLLQDLQETRNITYLFITHDLSVVRYISHDICVMYLGQAVEKCASDVLFRKPYHPYTKALLSAIPTLDIKQHEPESILEGEIVSPINPEPGCRFAARCKHACEQCHQPQRFIEIEKGHFAACCRVKEINEL